MIDLKGKKHYNKYGCILLLEMRPHLFMFNSKNELLESIPLEDHEDVYEFLPDDEIVISLVEIYYKENIVNTDFINDENYEDLMYKIKPIFVYKLKANGMITEDVVDLEYLDILLKSIIDNLDN